MGSAKRKASIPCPTKWFEGKFAEKCDSLFRRKQHNVYWIED